MSKDSLPTQSLFPRNSSSHCSDPEPSATRPGCRDRFARRRWNCSVIARYRKEATGNLDEVQIRSIEENLAYFRELAERRATILSSIAEQAS
jgi:hypothetical protein